ncbi:hypothetical protein [Nitrosomonas communis]|uniref:hypothetical protein n=1 Tax=Nitrosomonas communis TaxID=44574 RepID=UPI003D29E8A6
MGRVPVGPVLPRRFGESRAQTGPSGAHSRPLRGGAWGSHPVRCRRPLDGR